MKCNTGSYSQLSTKCQACPNKDSCGNKRLEAVAYIIPNEQPTISNNINIDIGNKFVNADDIIKALNKSLEIKLKCGFTK